VPKQPPRETPLGDSHEQPRTRRLSGEVIVALVAVVLSTGVALFSVWQTTRQSETQFQRDLVKQDRAELRTVLDATNETAARLTTDFAEYATNWLKKRQVSRTGMESRLNESTTVAARLAVRLDEKDALPVAYQRLNHEFVIVRDAVLAGTNRPDDIRRVAKAALDMPATLADVWTASFALGKSALGDPE
jgi:hypothetical protein